MTARVVVIAGAPSGGGSIFVRALREAGVAMEPKRAAIADLVGAQKDVTAKTINKGAIYNSGGDLLDPDSLDRVVAPDGMLNTARGFARSRSEGGAPWGWHDPRATLFLDLWDEVLEEPLWVFPVRDPACHIWSLVCRLYADRRWPSLHGRARLGLRLWNQFNERVLRFAERVPDRSLIVPIPAVFDGDAADRVERALAEHLGQDLPAGFLRRAFVPHLLTRKAPAWVRAFTALDTTSRRLSADLRARSVVGSSVQRASANGARNERVVCVVATQKGKYSETFIEAHVRRLPATVKFMHSAGPSLLNEDGMFVLGPMSRVRKAVRREFGLDDTASKARVLGRYLRRARVEAVLAEYSLNALEMMPACKFAGIPLVVHFHGYDAYLKARLDLYGKEVPELFRTAAACVVVSREMALQVESLGAPREKIVVNPCGVDVDDFVGADPGAAPPTFLAVGRFVEKKGPHLTLVAFAKALEKAPEARLVMVGDGELLAACKQLASALGIGDRVSFLGVVEHAGIVTLMRQCRAFVQHSHRGSDNNSEGTPVAVLEAGASGVPVLGTVHAGIADAIVHGETGLLVEERDVDGMAGYMVELAHSPALAARLGAAARERIAREYSMDQSVARLWRIIEDAIHVSARRSVEAPLVREAAERLT